MENGLFSTKAFKEWSKDVVLFAHITTRIPGRKHDGLLKTKGGFGFPTLTTMDAKGRVYERPARKLKAIGAATKRLGSLLRLKAKAKRTPGEELELLGAEVGLGLVPPAAARQRLDAIKLPAERKHAVSEVLARKACDEELKTLIDAPPAGGLSAKFWAMYQAGQRPTEAFENKVAGRFYSELLRYGLSQKLAGPARAGYEGTMRIYSDYPQARRSLARMKAAVEALEAKSPTPPSQD